MMAEVDIGKHCCFPSCNQLDFLPFYCDDCSQTFCKDHRSRNSHQCIQDDAEVDKDLRCPTTSSFISYSCYLDACKNTILTPVICEHCKKNFCLSHRHQQDHACEMLVQKPDPMQNTAELIKHITESKKSKPPKPKKQLSAKAQKTAAKVALMKMKMHAVGDQSIPQCERLYFKVYLPQTHREIEKSRTMYFSKVWSVGRLVDKVASTVGIRNDNNLSTNQKLRLFHPVTGTAYQMEQKLCDLLECDEPLYSGGEVIVEYVKNECSQLDEVDLYKL